MSQTLQKIDFCSRLIVFVRFILLGARQSRRGYAR
jgi:hypothetical protein